MCVWYFAWKFSHHKCRNKWAHTIRDISESSHHSGVGRTYFELYAKPQLSVCDCVFVYIWKSFLIYTLYTGVSVLKLYMPSSYVCNVWMRQIKWMQRSSHCAANREQYIKCTAMTSHTIHIVSYREGWKTFLYSRDVCTYRKYVRERALLFIVVKYCVYLSVSLVRDAAAQQLFQRRRRISYDDITRARSTHRHTQLTMQRYTRVVRCTMRQRCVYSVAAQTVCTEHTNTLNYSAASL